MKTQKASPKPAMYIVSWRYPDRREFAQATRMTEAQARRAEEFLKRYWQRGHLSEASVDRQPDGVAPFADLVKIFREEFPSAEKEWAP